MVAQVRGEFRPGPHPYLYLALADVPATCPITFLGDAGAKGSRDGLVTLGRRVLVDHRGPGRAVSHARHQASQAGTSAIGESVAQRRSGAVTLRCLRRTVILLRDTASTPNRAAGSPAPLRDTGGKGGQVLPLIRQQPRRTPSSHSYAASPRSPAGPSTSSCTSTGSEATPNHHPSKPRSTDDGRARAFKVARKEGEINDPSGRSHRSSPTRHYYYPYPNRQRAKRLHWWRRTRCTGSQRRRGRRR